MKSILKFPSLYIFYQKIIGDKNFRKYYSEKYLRIKNEQRVLDFGCGPGNIIPYLPNDIEYYGIDQSKEYINYAKKHFKKSNYKFIEASINDISLNIKNFDVVMANAILMNLNDYEAELLLKNAYNLLKNGGRLVIYDGCYSLNLSLIEQILLNNERGEVLRTKEDYFKLASKFFKEININTRNDLYRIPYPSIIIECIKS